MAPIDPTSEQTEENATTVIAEDVRIKGRLSFDTSLVLKGSLEGEIASEGLLVVGPMAKINATVVTRRMISHGEIQGDVTAREDVVLKRTSLQKGHITAPRIIVEGGSIFNGSCTMKREAGTELPQRRADEERPGPEGQQEPDP